MIYTTLNKIRERNPCADGWRKLLTHLGKYDPYAPLAYSTILESNGLDDALWCLRAEPQHASIWRMYAVRCARRVQHLITDKRSIRALDVAERHARGLATDEELAAAWYAARYAAEDAAEAAARYAAEDAARYAAEDAARAAAWYAARYAAEDAARAAAWYAARAAAWYAAWYAAGDAQDAAWYAAEDAARAAAWYAAWYAAGDAAGDAEDAARDAIRADFERMLAAHHAMPLESCALVDWWQGGEQ